MLCLFILYSEIQGVGSFVALGEPCMEEELWHMCLVCRAAETQNHSEFGFRMQALSDIFR